MPGNSQAHIDEMAKRDKRAAEDAVGARDGKAAPAPAVEETPVEEVEAVEAE